MFTFTFNVRQTPMTAPDPNSNTVDTQINGLTYVYAPTSREVENLVTREFHADPNLHKNSNVELIGDFTTGGSGSVTFDWAWKWKPPRNAEDSGGGWRNSCSVCFPGPCRNIPAHLMCSQFVQYDSRAHELQTLASFSFWVQSMSFAGRYPFAHVLTVYRHVALPQPAQLPAALPPDRTTEKPRCFLPVRRVENQHPRDRRACLPHRHSARH